MEYEKTIRLKNGSICHLRSATAQDGQAVMENFNTTHAETDFLLSYPEENSFTAQEESAFLARKAESMNEVELLAIVDGRVAGTAVIESLGSKYKVRHRAEFGISILREFWNLGIGGALLDSCIECARAAAGADGGGGQRKRPRPVQKEGLHRIRPESPGLPLPPVRLPGAGADAAGAVAAESWNL